MKRLLHSLRRLRGAAPDTREHDSSCREQRGADRRPALSLATLDAWPVIPEADRMISEQIAARTNLAGPIVDVMRRLDRRLFVAPDLAQRAWDDGPLPIGEGQTISQPYIVAAMTALLLPLAGSRVLELGTGSGYQTAVLAALGAEVVTIERHEALAQRARSVLGSLGFEQITYLVGDGTSVEQGRQFDRILFAAASARLPDQLADLLAPGGVMVGPVDPAAVPNAVRPLDDGWQRLLRWNRDASGALSREDLYSVRFVPLVEDGSPPTPLCDDFPTPD